MQDAFLQSSTKSTHVEPFLRVCTASKLYHKRATKLFHKNYNKFGPNINYSHHITHE